MQTTDGANWSVLISARSWPEARVIAQDLSLRLDGEHVEDVPWSS